MEATTVGIDNHTSIIITELRNYMAVYLYLCGTLKLYLELYLQPTSLQISVKLTIGWSTLHCVACMRY